MLKLHCKVIVFAGENTKQVISSQLKWIDYVTLYNIHLIVYSSKQSKAKPIIQHCISIWGSCRTIHTTVYFKWLYIPSLLLFLPLTFFSPASNKHMHSNNNPNDYNHKIQMFVAHKSGDLIVYGANVLGCLLMNRVRLPNLNGNRVWHKLDIFQQ